MKSLKFTKSYELLSIVKNICEDGGKDDSGGANKGGGEDGTEVKMM